MSHTTDTDFVAHLRGMASTTPVIPMPDAATIVRAGRSRIARRRSAFAGAFGIALFAGAGLSTLAGGPAVGPLAPSPIAMVAESAVESAADSLLVRGAPQPVQPLGTPLPGEVGGAPAAGEVGAVPAAPAAAMDLGISTETPGQLDSQLIEATPPTPVERVSPLATGLGIAGTASLATAAGLAIRSRRLQPALAKATTR